MKRETRQYKNINYTVSVYGENKRFGGETKIIMNHGYKDEVTPFTLTTNFRNQEEAKKAIIQGIEKIIDAGGNF